VVRVVLAHHLTEPRVATRRVLEQAGCDVAEADSADATLAVCRHAQPEVVVLDAVLCRHEGRTLLTEIKSDPELFALPVVLVDREVGVDQAIEAVRRGAHGLLLPDVAPPELMAAVFSAERTGALQRQLLDREDALEDLAYTDELTCVVNRRYLRRQLDAWLSSARRHDRQVALLLIDLDRFKDVNDRLGHGVGDQVLRAVAERLRHRLRAEDVLGRWGGEEFVAVLPETDAPGAGAVAEALRARIADEPLAVEGGEVAVTASIGWALWEGERAERLLARADEALYAAKAAGRDTIRAATPTTADTTTDDR